MRSLLPSNRPELPALIKLGGKELQISEKDLNRFLAYVVPQPTGEWRWTGKKTRDGYGTINLGGGSGGFVKAHRFSYAALVGPIPDDMDIDHIRHNDAFRRGDCPGGICVHRLEVDPAGLQPRPRAINILGGAGTQARAILTGACKWGHPLTGDNLSITIRKGRPVRVCRACKRRAYHQAVARRAS
jgi:hypothetical protein